MLGLGLGLGLTMQRGGGKPIPPEGFEFIIHNGAYVTRNGAYLVKAI